MPERLAATECSDPHCSSYPGVCCDPRHAGRTATPDPRVSSSKDDIEVAMTPEPGREATAVEPTHISATDCQGTFDRYIAPGRKATLYESPWHALRSAAEARGATTCGSARPHPSNPEMGGRTGSGLWVTSREDAEAMAEGLRLTGYEVVLSTGYSTGVVILDPVTPPARTATPDA